MSSPPVLVTASGFFWGFSDLDICFPSFPLFQAFLGSFHMPEIACLSAATMIQVEGKTCLSWRDPFFLVEVLVIDTYLSQLLAKPSL